MIDVSYQDGLYIVKLPKCVVAMTKAEFIQALRRGKAYRRRQALTARLANEKERT